MRLEDVLCALVAGLLEQLRRVDEDGEQDGDRRRGGLRCLCVTGGRSNWYSRRLTVPIDHLTR